MSGLLITQIFSSTAHSSLSRSITVTLAGCLDSILIAGSHLYKCPSSKVRGHMERQESLPGGESGSDQYYQIYTDDSKHGLARMTELQSPADIKATSLTLNPTETLMPIN